MANWLPIVSALSAVTTIGLAIADRPAGAGITAGFAVALLFLHHLPDLDTFKGWGVEATMRAQKVERDLARAEEILQRIDRLAGSLSSSTLSWLLHVGRLSSPTWEDRRTILAKIRDLHSGRMPSDVSRAEDAIFSAIGYHFWALMPSVLRERLRVTGSAQSNFSDQEPRKRITDAEVLRSELTNFLNEFEFSAADSAKLDKLIDRIVASYESSRELKPIDLDPYVSTAMKLYEETFGEPPVNTFY